MSLYGALFSGVSGLASQSSAMGAIADNVTNVNTIGYKSTKVNFKTLITKQVSTTQYSPGGVQSAPRQGVDIQGLLQATTSSTDVGISGQGFFIANQASEPSTGDLYAYTRAGSFKVDKDGYLTNVGGFYLQGWPLQTWDGTTTASQVTVGTDTYMKAYKNDNGEITYINDNVIDSTNLKGLNLNTIGGTSTATTTMSLGANLPADADVGASEKTNMLMYDSLGNAHNLNFTWFKGGQNAWGAAIEPPRGAATMQWRAQDGTSLYYSAGRLDYRDTGIPADGASMTFESQTINFSSTVDPDSDAGGGSLGLAAGDDWNFIAQDSWSYTGNVQDGDIISVNTGSRTYTFEFDNDGTLTDSAATSVSLGGTDDASMTNLASAIQSALESDLGPGNWSYLDATNNYLFVGGPAGTTTAETTDAGGVLTPNAGTDNGTDDLALGGDMVFNINPAGKTLSQIIDAQAELMNAVLVNFQGEPPAVPGHWATRVAGTTGITFAADETNSITFDTTNLVDDDGDIAVLQEDAGTGDSFTVTSVSGSLGWTVTGSSVVGFNGDGTPNTFFGSDESTEPDPRSSVYINWSNGALDMDNTTVSSGGSPAISLFVGNYNVPDGLTQLAGDYQINYITQNGAKFGNYAGLSIGEDGIVQALFDNGVTRPVFQIPIATFVNPNGMESLTGNAWIETDNSGQPTVRTAGDAGAGTVAAASLEASTVDLGEEFTTMITTQRAYSAAAKIITTSDEMLDELVRIKR